MDVKIGMKLLLKIGRNPWTLKDLLSRRMKEIE